jgi:hypothetical protein
MGLLGLAYLLPRTGRRLWGLHSAMTTSRSFLTPAGTAALTSYEADEDGHLVVVTPALGDTQTAACWVVVPRNGKFAYTSNSASGTISSYTVSNGGHLTLLNVKAASTGNLPIDMALSNNSRFLYARNAANGTISGFRVGSDGSLTAVTGATGLPAGAQGIAAR